MGYQVKRINGDLADYAFQINGALALKNYTATVEGSRLRIAHTQNAALSILECEVSEVEIDGKVYDNPIDAQRALDAIIYADLPILVLTREERDRFLALDAAKLESSEFQTFKTENQSTLNQKVDKEEGKGLSANDFTEELKNKLEKFSNLSTADQSIEEGVERSIDVQGKLNITGLEDVESNDTSFRNKLVINEDGTLAKKVDEIMPNITISVPSTVTITNRYETSRPYESYTIEISEKLKQFNTLEWEDVEDNFWKKKSYNGLYDDKIELLRNGKDFKAQRDVSWGISVPDTDEFYSEVFTDYIFGASLPDFFLRMDLVKDAQIERTQAHAMSGVMLENVHKLSPVLFNTNHWDALPMFETGWISDSHGHSYYLFKIVGKVYFYAINRLTGYYRLREISLPENINYRLKFFNPNMMVQQTKIKNL